jgi:hypothetical protein
MAYKISNSRVPHGRSETFDSIADAAIAVAAIPGATLGDVVPVRTGQAEEEQRQANQLADARRAAAQQAKAAEDEAKVIAIASDLAAREAKAKHDAALDAVAADKIAADTAAKGR